MSTYQEYTRERGSYGETRYVHRKNGTYLTQEQYEQLWMKENPGSQKAVVLAPRRTPVESPVGKSEGFRKLFTGQDFESRLKRELITFGLSEEEDRRMYANIVGNAAMVAMPGTGGVLKTALQFGALKGGMELFASGDVKKAGSEALGETTTMAALGGVLKTGGYAMKGAKKTAAWFRRHPVAQTALGISAVAGASGSVLSSVPKRTGDEEPNWQNMMNFNSNRIPDSVSIPVSELRQDAKGGSDDRFRNSRTFLATDKVPETIFGVPVVSKPDQYTEEDKAFFREHPEAGGYYDMEDSEVETAQDDKGGDTGWDPYRNAEDAIAKAVPFIKEHEGFRDTAYLDAVGKWTIGYGQTELDGKPVKKGDRITEKDAAKFVEDRVRRNAAELYRTREWTKNVGPGALAALYDIAYNAGTAALSPAKSPGLNSEMEAADVDFDSIVWNNVPTYRTAGGRVLKGLVNRRNDAVKAWKETT